MTKAIAIVSGGMDSVTLAYLLKSKDIDTHLISFNYGQKHKKELIYAKAIASLLNQKHTIIDLTSVGDLLKGSALTDDIDVPEGHYASDNMKVTVVPNRNAIMLSIAYGIAVAEDADMVSIGVHAGDHFVYPDCRPDFIKSFDSMQKVAVEGFGKESLYLYAPFMEVDKHDIALIGSKLDVPYDKTWSCYKGNELHCGKCGTCIERKEAFELADIKDTTIYE